MTTNKATLILLKAILSENVGCGFWQFAVLIDYIMDNPDSFNSFRGKVYPFVAQQFDCKPRSVEKNISRLIPFVNCSRLSELTGENIDIETLTVKKLVKYILLYLKLNTV